MHACGNSLGAFKGRIQLVRARTILHNSRRRRSGRLRLGSGFPHGRRRFFAL